MCACSWRRAAIGTMLTAEQLLLVADTMTATGRSTGIGCGWMAFFAVD